MWSFLAKLFSNKTQDTVREVTLKNEVLVQFLEQEIKIRAEQIQKKLGSAREQLTALKHDLEVALQALEQAQLANTAIPEQHKSIAFGNRVEYCKRVRAYAEQLALPHPIEELLAFFLTNKQATKELAQSIQHPFAVLQEFFAHESKAVVQALHYLELHMTAVHEQVTSTHVQKLTRVLEQSREYVAACQRQDALRVEQLQQESSLLETRHHQDRLRTTYAGIEQSSEQQELRKSLEQIRNLVAAQESVLQNMFAPLDAALRKYARLSVDHEALVERYLANPVVALSQDIHLKIIDVLAKLQQATWSDQLELKAEKKTKTIFAIAELTKPFLQHFITNYAKLKRDENNAQKALQSHQSTQHLQQLDQECAMLEQEVQSLRRQISDRGKELAKHISQDFLADLETCGVRVLLDQPTAQTAQEQASHQHQQAL